MAFWKNPIIEEPPECLACGTIVYDGLIICSATCEDIWKVMGSRSEPQMDWGDLDEFIAEQHESRYETGV